MKDDPYLVVQEWLRIALERATQQDAEGVLLYCDCAAAAMRLTLEREEATRVRSEK